MSEGFQGNKNVKAGGTKTSYTREQIVEYAKCADDPCYFIENYVKVISLDAGVVPFKLRPYQRRIIEAVHNNRFTLAMLFRQSGKSTILAAYMLWYATFNDHKTSVLLANKQAQAIEIFSRVQYMYELLPDWLKQGALEWNKKSVHYENGSRIIASATSSSAVRGMSCVTSSSAVSLSINDDIYHTTIEDIITNYPELLVTDGYSKTDAKILTEEGFKSFKGVICQGERPVIDLVLSNGQTLSCTKDHRIRMPDFNGEPEFVEAEFLSAGDVLYNGVTIIDVHDTGRIEKVYDALEVEETHSFYANGIVVSNCNLLVLDEFAFIPSGIAEDFIMSVFPTLTSSKESKLVLCSTPNGLNSFYRMWKDAENGKNDFVTVRGYWNEIYDQKWYEEQCRLLNNDMARVNQELNCQFLGSAQTLIDSNKIQCLVAENPIYEVNNLRIFEAPKDGHSYFMTVDVSRGRGLDYSAVIVFDVTAMPFKVVATYKDNNVSPMELPTLLYELGNRYNEALVMIEANDLGESVANELWWTLEYPGVLHTKDGKIGGSGILGVKTTKGVKSRGCAKVKELIENDQLIVSDQRIIEELEGYVLGKRGTYEAQNTKINDDLCACLFLFGWSCESNYFQDYAKTDVSRTLIDRYKADVEDTMPTFGCMSDGGNDPYENLRLSTEQMDMLK